MFTSRFAGRSLRAELAVASIGLATGAIALGAGDADDHARAPALLGQSHGLQYSVEQATGPNPVVIVSCSGQTAPTGGGTFLDTAAPADGVLTNSTPQPAGDPAQRPDEGWLSEAAVGGGTTVLSYAICSNRPGKLRYRSDALFVPPESSRPLTTRCPRGTAVTGGGALTDGDTGVIELVGSRPNPAAATTPRGWFAKAHNYDDAQHSLVVYAICSKQEGKYSYKRGTVGVPDGNPTASAHKVVNCPRRRAVSGGGTDISGFEGDAWLITSSPQPAGDSKVLPKRGWIGEAGSLGGGTLRVWAICKR